jgi:hypothetical protein
MKQVPCDTSTHAYTDEIQAPFLKIQGKNVG